MAKRTLSLHPKSLDPFQAAKAWLQRAKLKPEQVAPKLYELAGRQLCTNFAFAMAKRALSLHPKSLDPFQAAKAWLSRAELKLKQIVVRTRVGTVSSKASGQKSLENVVWQAAARKKGRPKLEYANYGRTWAPTRPSESARRSALVKANAQLSGSN